MTLNAYIGKRNSTLHHEPDVREGAYEANVIN